MRVIAPRNARLASISFILTALSMELASSADLPPFDPGLLDFSVEIHGVRSAYRTLGVYVLPGERVQLTVEAARGTRSAARRFAVAVGGLSLTSQRRGAFVWTAPAEPGLHVVEITEPARPDGGTMRLNVLVMRPYSELTDGFLNGYRIGEYPKHPLRGLAIYRPPRGFVEVTPDLVELAVSPHFTLGQFLCKQESGFPKYVVLRERLLLKLEMILAEVNASGISTDGLTVMSGYRTPYYNAAIGNVTYSRHLWGGAADIYVDVAPLDGVMDDLDGDGRIDGRDTAFIRDIVERLQRRPLHSPLVGGLARYGRTAAHGPFVHVDVRGTPARWGD